jgi:hypothetical protein
MKQDFMESLKEIATPDQRIAMRELERRGYRFCVDFGYQNAIEILESMCSNDTCTKPARRASKNKPAYCSTTCARRAYYRRTGR